MEEDGAMQCLCQGFGQFLFFADGPELRQIVFVARGVFFADFFFLLVKYVEIFAQIAASRRFHVGCQVLDALFDLSVFALFPGIFPVADESAPLRQVVQGAAERPAVVTVVEIEFFGQGAVAIMVGILVSIVVRSLPLDESVVERVGLAFAPLSQLLVAQRRAQVVFDEYLEHLDFTQSAAEIVTTQRPRIGSVLHGRFFVVCLARYALLENVDSSVEQCISVFGLFCYGPSQRVGAQIQS